jgi:hypothetical protein
MTSVVCGKVFCTFVDISNQHARLHPGNIFKFKMLLQMLFAFAFSTIMPRTATEPFQKSLAMSSTYSLLKSLMQVRSFYTFVSHTVHARLVTPQLAIEP